MLVTDQALGTVKEGMGCPKEGLPRVTQPCLQPPGPQHGAEYQRQLPLQVL